MIIGKCSPYNKIYLDQDRKCIWCKQPYPAKSMSRDHVLPLSKGYPILRYREEDRTIRYANMVLACERCNSFKSNRTLEEFEMWIMEKKEKASIWWEQMVESIMTARKDGLEELHLQLMEKAKTAKDVMNWDEHRKSRYK